MEQATSIMASSSLLQWLLVADHGRVQHLRQDCHGHHQPSPFLSSCTRGSPSPSPCPESVREPRVLVSNAQIYHFLDIKSNLGTLVNPAYLGQVATGLKGYSQRPRSNERRTFAHVPDRNSLDMERLAAISRRQHPDPSKETEELRPPAGAKLETIIIGLSGPSSSGKTTLARLLREIFNLQVAGLKVSLAILHQDDAYKTDKDVPTINVTSKEFGTRELQDWDCMDSLDLPLFEHTLRHLHDHGSLPPDSVSKEDENSVGESHVSSEEVEEWKLKVKSWLEDCGQGRSQESKLEQKQIRIYIVDGFLLYPPAPSPSQANTYPHTQEGLNHLHGLSQTLLQPRLFIPSTRQQTLTRRAARSGYVTLEGFWTDPAGYVEDVVWPNYILYHSWMYKDGDVDGEEFDDKVCESQNLNVCPGGGHWKMPRVLDWAVQQIKESITARV